MGQRNRKSRLVKIKTIIGILLCAVFGCLLFCNVTILVKGAMDPDTPPSIFGVTPMVVLSGSMSGTQDGHIEVGDLIFVGKTKAEQLKVGDVIAYKSGGTTVTHRITAMDTAEDGSLLFTTKGDANEAEDAEAIAEEQLIGIYRGRIPKVGDFALFLQQPLGMLLFMGVPVLAFIIYDILRRQRYANREKAKVLEMEQELAQLRALTGEGSTSSADTLSEP